MKKQVVIQTASGLPFLQYRCKDCGGSFVASTDFDDVKCVYCCGSKLTSSEVMEAKELSAATEDVKKVTCSDCNTEMSISFADSSAEELAMTHYCIACGGNNLEGQDESPMNESSNDTNVDDDSFEEAAEDKQEQVEEGVQQALEGSKREMLTASKLQWSVVDDEINGQNGTLIASNVKSGIPVFIFHKHEAPKGIQPLFATSSFIEAFNQVAETKSLPDAVKAFGGITLAGKDIVSSLDLESMALTRLEATALPRLIDCCQMAVEGGIKGIYTEVASTLQECMVSELVATGIPVDRAERAVQNSFALHGSTLFGAIIAKALELYNKPEVQRIEAKTMITAAAGPSFQPFDAEQLKVRSALNQQDIVVTPAVTLSASHRGLGATADAIKALQKQLF